MRSPTLGVTDLRIVAPAALMPEAGGVRRAARASTPSTRGIAGCDVVMMLRIQSERLADATIPVRR